MSTASLVAGLVAATVAGFLLGVAVMFPLWRSERREAQFWRTRADYWFDSAIWAQGMVTRLTHRSVQRSWDGQPGRFATVDDLLGSHAVEES